MAENGTSQQLVPMTEFLEVCSQLVQRLTLRHGVTFQGNRNLYDTLGYQRILEYRDYYARYKRGGIAQPLITAFTSKTWRLPPVITEDEKADETVVTPFEAAWEALAQRLRIWHVFERLDRLASLGHYAVLVLGLRGQTEWNMEARPVRGPDDLLYVQAFSEEHARLLELVSEPSSPLFGTPLRYDIDFSRRQTEIFFAQSAARPSLGGQYGTTVPVHASRIIHVAENGLEDDYIGTPGLEAVWNYLDDLDKQVGGVAEMTWQDAKRRLVMALKDGATLSEPDALALDDRIEQFLHGLRNILKVQNIDVTQLAGQVPDASANVDKLLELIAATKRIPKRLLLGSERGELSSTQDDENFAETIAGRQQHHADPTMLRAFVDRLIHLRVLPTPRVGYTSTWPPLLMESEAEKATTALTWSQALSTYAGPGSSPEQILPLEIYLNDIVGWDKEQVDRIIDLLGRQEAARPALPSPPDEQEVDDSLTEP